MELGDAQALEVLVDVLSTDAVRIRPGMPVMVEEWGGARMLEGRVRTVSPSAFTRVSALGVEEQRVNVVADLLIDPDAPLGEGYRVEARIVTWEGANVLKVPLSALFRHGSGWAVFVAEAGRALVIAFNKWDLVDEERRYYLDREIERDLVRVPWAPRVNITARTGWHVDKLVPERSDAPWRGPVPCR